MRSNVALLIPHLTLSSLATRFKNIFYDWSRVSWQQIPSRVQQYPRGLYEQPHSWTSPLLQARSIGTERATPRPSLWSSVPFVWFQSPNQPCDWTPSYKALNWTTFCWMFCRMIGSGSDRERLLRLFSDRSVVGRCVERVWTGEIARLGGNTDVHKHHRRRNDRHERCERSSLQGLCIRYKKQL